MTEPIAIVGMGCRFAPDLDSPEKYWRFLMAGRDAVGAVPPMRWEPYASSNPEVGAVLRRTTRFGAFLDDIEGFDAGFFGISPREAASVDPQQRILLEVAWEALEHAGIPPSSLTGGDVGVFVAANSFDYAQRLMGDLPRMEAWALNGGMFFALANRVSYVLDLRGPSLVVDTACAGSLTCLHLACQALRERETPLALAAGVNIMAGPGPIVALDAAGATAPDGRSKAFDESADGYGRGEGAGVVVLKRLGDARRDGDRVLALVLGSGVFQDGRTGGMWAPNGDAQVHMMREVYRRMDISPNSVGYVEAHGTGTPIGDQVEAEALSRVYGPGRPADRPCLIGSVKPNIGHLEAAAGIAGVIKTVLALRHGELPPSLHTRLNPAVDWDRSGLRVVPSVTPWPGQRGPRRAAVSSYGMGGTIAHAVLEDAPRSASPVAEAPPRTRIFPVSAASESGLRALAARLADWLDEHPGTKPESVGHTLARRRSHLVRRAAILAVGTDDLAARLRKLATDPRSPSAAGAGVDPVWVFSGHGAQWPGMGRQLLDREPAFAATLDALEPVFRAELGFAPRTAVADGDWSTVTRVQAMTFAMQVGLAAVWRGYGLRPGAVIGHSVGEIAAAVSAGALDLPDAARFACRRAALLQKKAGRGAMAMVDRPYAEVRRRLAHRDDVVAAIDASPDSTVISGDPAALASVLADWAAEGIAGQQINTDVAFHSPQLDMLRDDVSAAAADLTTRPPDVPLYSTAMDDPRTDTPRDRAYWVANLRNPVRFSAAVQAAIADGHRMFLEVSAHPVVTHSITDALTHAGIDDGYVGYSLRRGTPERERLLTALAELHCRGAAVDWSCPYPAGELVDLPTIAWQHRPYWISSARPGGRPGGGHDPDSHTLLGARTVVSGVRPTQVWETYLDLSCRPYPGRHPVHEVEIVPAGVLINTLMIAASHGDRLPALADVTLRTPVAISGPRLVQVVHGGDTVQIASRLLDGDELDDELPWITHTTAVARPGSDLGRIEDLAAIRARCRTDRPWPAVEELLRRRGVGGYGFAWRVDEVTVGDGELLATVTIRPESAESAGSWAELLDGALTPTILSQDETLRMPAHIRSVAVHGVPPGRVVVHARRSTPEVEDTLDVRVADESGRVVAEVTGLHFGVVHGRPGAVIAPRRLVHELAWRPLKHEPGPVPESVVVLSEEHGWLAPVLGDLERAGVRCRTAIAPEQAASIAATDGDVVLFAPAIAGSHDATEDAAERSAWSLVSTAQALVSGPGNAARLWCLTRGVRDCADEAALAHAPLWGVARIIAGEHPDLWGGLVDVAVGTTAVGARLLAAMHVPSTEDVIALTQDGDLVARLVAVERAPARADLACRSDGTYLITGGLGALGLETARWLVSLGARRIVLAGRRALPPRHEWRQVTDGSTRRRIDAVLALEALGATVRVVALDVGDGREVARALDPATLELPPIRGIVHAAGVTRDALLPHTDRPSVAQVMWPKVRAVMALHRLFPPGTLDFFVLFSSCGQFARLTGQTSYAAANSFLDALATHRNTGPCPDTLSIGWTGWRDLGMSATASPATVEAAARGIDTISATEAFAAWRLAMRFDSPYLALLRPHPPRTGGALPVLSELSPEVAADTGDGPTQQPVDWSSLPEQALVERVTAAVRDEVAAVLRLAPADLEPRHPLTEIGMDSVMTAVLRVNLRQRFGIELPPSILWKWPTVSALATHLIERIAHNKPQRGDAA